MFRTKIMLPVFALAAGLALRAGLALLAGWLVGAGLVFRSGLAFEPGALAAPLFNGRSGFVLIFFATVHH